MQQFILSIAEINAFVMNNNNDDDDK